MYTTASAKGLAFQVSARIFKNLKLENRLVDRTPNQLETIIQSFHQNVPGFSPIVLMIPATFRDLNFRGLLSLSSVRTLLSFTELSSSNPESNRRNSISRFSQYVNLAASKTLTLAHPFNTRRVMSLERKQSAIARIDRE